MIVYKKNIGPDIGIWRWYECWVNNDIFVCLIISSWVRRVVGFPLQFTIPRCLFVLYVFVRICICICPLCTLADKQTHTLFCCQ